MTQQTHTIAESNNFIVLDKYTKVLETGDSYQSESDLERELIQDLLNQGYEFISVKSPTAMLANVRDQLQRLNGVVFNESEWRRFAEQYLDSPSAWTKPVKSISTISVILRLMMVVWKTSI
jgi:type I restriction enzyme R subunit